MKFFRYVLVHSQRIQNVAAYFRNTVYVNVCVYFNKSYCDVLSQRCVPSTTKECTPARYESVLQALLENPII